MDDSGIDSDTTKRHTTTIKENDQVIIHIVLYYKCIIQNMSNYQMLFIFYFLKFKFYYLCLNSE